jgi:hypothetical protein
LILQSSRFYSNTSFQTENAQITTKSWEGNGTWWTTPDSVFVVFPHPDWQGGEFQQHPENRSTHSKTAGFVAGDGTDSLAPHL